jgi:hypothetical protein
MGTVMEMLVQLDKNIINNFLAPEWTSSEYFYVDRLLTETGVLELNV